MMSRKKVLQHSVLGLMLVGIVLVSIPFISSMKPSARANAVSSPLDIADQEAGTVREYSTHWGRAFVVRKSEDDVVVYHIWMDNLAYMLPDEKWYRAYIPCEDFGVDPRHGLITEESVFRCRQSRWGSWWETEHVWNLDGESLGQSTEDMPPAPFERYGDKLIIDPWKQLDPANSEPW